MIALAIAVAAVVVYAGVAAVLCRPMLRVWMSQPVCADCGYWQGGNGRTCLPWSVTTARGRYLDHGRQRVPRGQVRVRSGRDAGAAVSMAAGWPVMLVLVGLLAAGRGVRRLAGVGAAAILAGPLAPAEARLHTEQLEQRIADQAATIRRLEAEVRRGA